MSRFEINNINLITSWSFRLKHNKDCTICRNCLNSNSGYNADKGINSQFILISACGHAFHEECIEPWIKKTNKCPVCCKVWQTVDKLEYPNKII